LLDLNYSFEQVKELAALKFENFLTLRERIDILKSKLPTAEFAYTKCESYLPNLIVLSDIVENEIGIIAEMTFTEPTIKIPQHLNQPLNSSQQSLSFDKLFISPYSEKIDLLIEQLQKIGLIVNNDWREWENGRVEKNETSKLYYYLKQNKVLSDYTTPTALKCFNDKFGIEVYKDNEEPKTERYVSLRTLTKTEESNTKTKLLNKFEIVLQKWIEGIELK